MKQVLILLIFITLFFIPQAAGIDNATAKMENLSAANVSIDISNQPIYDFIDWDDSLSSYQNIRNIITAPIRYAASSEFLGYWFYMFCMLVVLIYVYGKSQSVETTSMIMMLMGIMVLLPSLTGVLVAPTSFIMLMFVCTLLGFVGVLSGFVGDD